jgi:outer membrane lipoprotein SlyB
MGIPWICISVHTNLEYLQMKRESLYTMIVMASLVLASPGIASAQSTNNGVLDRDDGIYIRCAMCGTVESITQNIGNQKSGSGGNTAATITGSVVGGVLGNQVGGGRGRKLATVGGAVAGGNVGNAMAGGGSNSQRNSWTVRVKLGGSNFVNVMVSDASDLRVGDMVEVDSNGYVTRLR